MFHGSGVNRRGVLLFALGTTTTAFVAPNRWKKPVIESLLLPAHAQTSPSPASSVRTFRLLCSDNAEVNMTVHQFLSGDRKLLGNYKTLPTFNSNTDSWVLRNPYEAGDFLLSEGAFRTKYQPILDASSECDSTPPQSEDEDLRQFAVTCSTNDTISVDVFQHYNTGSGEILGNYVTSPRRDGDTIDVSAAQPYRADLFKLNQSQFIAAYQPELDASPECSQQRCEDEDITIELSHPFANFSEFSVNKLDIFFPLKLTGTAEVVDITASIVGSGNVSDDWYEVVSAPSSISPAAPNQTVHVRYRVDRITDEACLNSFFVEGQKPLVQLVVRGRCATNASITTEARLGTIGANCVFIKGLTP